MRFIKNLFFLRIGALPTATRCTLTFGFDFVVEGESVLFGDCLLGDGVSTVVILNFTSVFSSCNNCLSSLLHYRESLINNECCALIPIINGSS